MLPHSPLQKRVSLRLTLARPRVDELASKSEGKQTGSQCPLLCTLQGVFGMWLMNHCTGFSFICAVVWPHRDRGTLCFIL